MRKKWKYLRDRMMTCLKKIEVADRSGSVANRTPTCKHFGALLFLKHSVSNRAPESNISQLDLTIDSDSVSAEPQTTSLEIYLLPYPVVAPKRSRVDFEGKFFEEAGIDVIRWNCCS